MEPRRCGVHGLVIGEDGRCVICRRGDPELGPAKTSSDWPIVAMLALFGVLVVGSGGYWITKRIAALVQTQPAPEGKPVPAVDTNQAAEEELAKYPAPKFTAERQGDAVPVAAATDEPLSEQELAALRKKVPITMYMKPRCSLCDQARGLLKSRGIPLKEVDVDASATDKVLLESINAAGSVPTFDVAGKVLVGYEPNVLLSAIDKAATRKKR
jgi:glutaredoxin